MEPTEAGSETKTLGSVVQIDEGKIQAHLDEVVRSTVEETLNALLDAEADQLCGARKYERAEGRKDTRAGSYERQLQTKAGEVSLKVPKLRSLPFETAISSATGGVSLRWKRRWWRCTWPVLVCVVWKTSRRRCGAHGYRPRR